MPQKKVIILLGPPGSGKGTQAKLLTDKFGLEYIGSGDLLRARKKKNDFTGINIGKWIDEGKRLPTPIIFNIWMNKLESFKNKESKLKGIVFDGSPRTVEEAEMLETALDWYGWAKGKKAVHVRLLPKQVIWRLTKRRICVNCKRIIPYVGDFRGLKECDKCGGKLAARADDTIKGIKTRLSWFDSEVIPVVNYYKKRGELVVVNGDQPIKDVFDDILKIIK